MEVPNIRKPLSSKSPLGNRALKKVGDQRNKNYHSIPPVHKVASVYPLRKIQQSPSQAQQPGTRLMPIVIESNYNNSTDFISLNNPEFMVCFSTLDHKINTSGFRYLFTTKEQQILDERTHEEMHKHDKVLLHKRCEEEALSATIDRPRINTHLFKYQKMTETEWGSFKLEMTKTIDSLWSKIESDCSSIKTLVIPVLSGSCYKSDNHKIRDLMVSLLKEKLLNTSNSIQSVIIGPNDPNFRDSGIKLEKGTSTALKIVEERYPSLFTISPQTVKRDNGGQKLNDFKTNFHQAQKDLLVDLQKVLLSAIEENKSGHIIDEIVKKTRIVHACSIETDVTIKQGAQDLPQITYNQGKRHVDVLEQYDSRGRPVIAPQAINIGFCESNLVYSYSLKAGVLDVRSTEPSKLFFPTLKSDDVNPIKSGESLTVASEGNDYVLSRGENGRAITGIEDLQEQTAESHMGSRSTTKGSEMYYILTYDMNPVDEEIVYRGLSISAPKADDPLTYYDGSYGDFQDYEEEDGMYYGSLAIPAPQAGLMRDPGFREYEDDYKTQYRSLCIPPPGSDSDDNIEYSGMNYMSLAMQPQPAGLMVKQNFRSNEDSTVYRSLSVAAQSITNPHQESSSIGEIGSREKSDKRLKNMSSASSAQSDQPHCLQSHESSEAGLLMPVKTSSPDRLTGVFKPKALTQVISKSGNPTVEIIKKDILEIVKTQLPEKPLSKDDYDRITEIIGSDRGEIQEKIQQTHGEQTPRVLARGYHVATADGDTSQFNMQTKYNRAFGSDQVKIDLPNSMPQDFKEVILTKRQSFQQVLTNSSTELIFTEPTSSYTLNLERFKEKKTYILYNRSANEQCYVIKVVNKGKIEITRFSKNGCEITEEKNLSAVQLPAFAPDELSMQQQNEWALCTIPNKGEDVSFESISFVTGDRELNGNEKITQQNIDSLLKIRLEQMLKESVVFEKDNKKDALLTELKQYKRMVNKYTKQVEELNKFLPDFEEESKALFVEIKSLNQIIKDCIASIAFEQGKGTIEGIIKKMTALEAQIKEKQALAVHLKKIREYDTSISSIKSRLNSIQNALKENVHTEKETATQIEEVKQILSQLLIDLTTINKGFSAYKQSPDRFEKKMKDQVLELNEKVKALRVMALSVIKKPIITKSVSFEDQPGKSHHTPARQRAGLDDSGGIMFECEDPTRIKYTSIYKKMKRFKLSASNACEDKTTFMGRPLTVSQLYLYRDLLRKLRIETNDSATREPDIENINKIMLKVVFENYRIIFTNTKIGRNPLLEKKSKMKENIQGEDKKLNTESKNEIGTLRIHGTNPAYVQGILDKVDPNRLVRNLYDGGDRRSKAFYTTNSFNVADDFGRQASSGGQPAYILGMVPNAPEKRAHFYYDAYGNISYTKNGEHEIIDLFNAQEMDEKVHHINGATYTTYNALGENGAMEPGQCLNSAASRFSASAIVLMPPPTTK